MKNNENPLILSLETCTRNGGIALLRGEDVLAEKAGLDKSHHSVRLLPDVRQLLDEINWDLQDVNLLVAAVGPGSFTGLKIGLATAKALVTALKIPSIGVSTLAAAASAAENSGEILIVIPAGRNEFFVQLFYLDSQSEARQLSEIKTCKLENIFQEFPSTNDLNVLADRETIAAISNYDHSSRLKFQEFPENLAVWSGKTAHRIFKQNKQNSFSLSPIYVRGADIGQAKNAK